MFDVSGKAAIVTGSAQGFGREFAIRLLKAGAKVCISDVDEKLGQATLGELQKEFGKNKVEFVKCDVSKEEDWKTLWQAAEKSLGYISILINNAGIPKERKWAPCLNVMLVGVGFGAYLAVSKMGKSKGGQGGRIINVGSGAGILIADGFELDVYGYTAAKWGTQALTRSFARAKPCPYETEGIKCYSINPSYASTNLTKAMPQAETERRFGVRYLTVEEVGGALMNALELDSNGAVLAVMPECPLTPVPNLNAAFMVALLLVGRVLRLLGVEVKHLSSNAIIVAGLVTLVVLSNFIMWLLGQVIGLFL